jgi:hypothetical protein
MINDFEAFWSFGIVYAANIHQLIEAQTGIVAQRLDNIPQIFTSDTIRQIPWALGGG